MGDDEIDVTSYNFECENTPFVIGCENFSILSQLEGNIGFVRRGKGKERRKGER
jgi:hypothetical protein